MNLRRQWRLTKCPRCSEHHSTLIILNFNGIIKHNLNLAMNEQNPNHRPDVNQESNYLQDSLFDFESNRDQGSLFDFEDEYISPVEIPVAEELPIEFEKPRRALSHNRLMELIRESGWYQNHLNLIDFNLKNLNRNKSFEEVLESYGACMENSPSPETDRNILRIELRRITVEENKRLAGIITERFPGVYYYEHNQAQDSVYEDVSAIAIVNSIGVNSLFGRSSQALITEMIRQNTEQTTYQKNKDVKGIQNLGLYDFLPNQFLISRIWAIKELLNNLYEHPDWGLSETVESFEAINKQTRNALIRIGKVFYMDTQYSCYHIDKYIQPITWIEESLVTKFGKVATDDRDVA